MRERDRQIDRNWFVFKYGCFQLQVTGNPTTNVLKNKGIYYTA